MSISRIVNGFASKNTVKSVFPFLRFTAITRPFSSGAGDNHRTGRLKNLLDKYTFKETNVPLTMAVDRKRKEEHERMKTHKMKRDLIESNIRAARNQHHKVALGMFNRALKVYVSIGNMDVYNAEQFYGPLLMFLIDRGMVREFYVMCDYIKMDEPTRCYYEMVLSVKAGDNVKLRDLIAKVVGVSTPVSLEKFIRRFCDSLEVHLAVDVVDSMLKSELTVTSSILDPILKACDECNDHYLVRRIYSMIKDHKIRADTELFSIMIKLLVKMEDFKGAYRMIDYIKRSDLSPTTGMYNTIMLGYLQKKRFDRGLKVLVDMHDSRVKPDCHTFTYIIGHCTRESDIVKYHKELCELGVPPTKHLFKALIHAYTACGLFEKARQVITENEISNNLQSELRSMLVYSLALNGKLAEAMQAYDEVVQAKGTLEPKAALCLIQNLNSADNMNHLLELLNHLKATDLWDAGCGSILLFCVRHKNLNNGIQLLKTLLEKRSTNVSTIHFVIAQMFWELWMLEEADPKFGLTMIKAIMEEIRIGPTRKALDFLLMTCRKAKDLKFSVEVWNMYEAAGLPSNVLTSLGMYQAFLASGDHESAKNMKETIPLNFEDMCVVLAASQKTLGI